MAKNQGIVSTVVDRVTLRGIARTSGKAGVNAYLKEQFMAVVGAVFFPLTATTIEALSGGERVQRPDGTIVEGRTIDLTGWSGWGINLAVGNLVGMAIDSPGFQAGVNGSAMMQVMYAELDTKVLSGIFGKRLHRLNTSVQSSLSDRAVAFVDAHGNTTPQALPQSAVSTLPATQSQAVAYTPEQIAQQIARTMTEQQKWGNGANHTVPTTAQVSVADVPTTNAITLLPSPISQQPCSACGHKASEHNNVVLADQHGTYSAKSWKSYKSNTSYKRFGKK